MIDRRPAQLDLQAMQTTPHRTMPNVRLNSGDLNNLVGYILSLKRAPQ